MECHGNGTDHCCWLGRHGACKFLEEYTVEGRRWACGLRRELGSWDKVHKDRRYRQEVRPVLREIQVAVDCGDWPQNDPVAMAHPDGKCCFQEVSLSGNVGS